MTICLIVSFPTNYFLHSSPIKNTTPSSLSLRIRADAGRRNPREVKKEQQRKKLYPRKFRIRTVTMPDPIPSCFRGSAAGGPPETTVAGPSLTTSVFETNLGLASLSWSRTVLGLSLRADLHLSPSSSDNDKEDDEPFRFRIRPWLFWKRKGTRRFHLEEEGDHGHRVIDVAWDLTRARFPSTGGPEPSSSFYVAVAVDGEMLLVAGDMGDEAHRKMKASKRKPAMPISKREHVLLKADPESGGRRSYRTLATVLGREREIAIEIGGKEKDSSGMCVAVDGTKILQVRRLRWKFRGSERVEIDGNGGGRVQISWDLHSWLFPPSNKEDAITPPASVASAAMYEIGQAVFVFRFDSCKADRREDWISRETTTGTGCPGGLNIGLFPAGYLGKERNWTESSGGVGERKKGRKKSLLKTNSSSSSSSSSSAGSSSVMEWVSPEEAELRGFDGYTLVVYAWKS